MRNLVNASIIMMIIFFGIFAVIACIPYGISAIFGAVFMTGVFMIFPIFMWDTTEEKAR